MINGPGYLGPGAGLSQAGMSIGQYDAQLNQVGACLQREQQYDPVRAEKEERENRKRMWLDNMPDTARSLDYIRRQLIDVDMQAEAKALDGVIVAMVNRWNEDRAKR